MRPWVYGQNVVGGMTKYLANMQDGKQIWAFRSLERGFWARLNLLGSKATPPTAAPQRVLWAQEPANGDAQGVRNFDEMIDLIAKSADDDARR